MSVTLTPILWKKCAYCGTPTHFTRQSCQECVVAIIIPQMEKEAAEHKKQQEIQNKVLENQAKLLLKK